MVYTVNIRNYIEIYLQITQQHNSPNVIFFEDKIRILHFSRDHRNHLQNIRH